MEFQEYPKALYRGDELQTVADAIGEAQARKEGFAEWQAEPVAQAAPEPHAAPAVRARKHKLGAESE